MLESKGVLRHCQAARLRVGDSNGALLPMTAGKLVANLRYADRAHLHRMGHTQQISGCSSSILTLDASGHRKLQQRLCS